jgi:signal transduction histidine kinase
MAMPEDLPKAIGDARRQRQVLANLVSNALKFSPQPQPVEVTVVMDGQEALVSVRDHGCGIAAEHLPKIFEKFYRVKGEGSPKAPGSGLGLYICKLLVEAQGGRIWAESAPGQGSTFSYTVRVVEARSAAHDEPAA